MNQGRYDAADEERDVEGGLTIDGETVTGFHVVTLDDEALEDDAVGADETPTCAACGTPLKCGVSRQSGHCRFCLPHSVYFARRRRAIGEAGNSQTQSQ